MTDKLINGLYTNVRPEVFQHPRLVFDSIGPDEESIIQFYLDKSKPFTVVITKARDNNG